MPFLLLAMRAQVFKSLLQNLSHVTGFNPSGIVDELLNRNKSNFQRITLALAIKDLFYLSFFQDLEFCTRKGAIGQVTCICETKLANISSKRSIFQC